MKRWCHGVTWLILLTVLGSLAGCTTSLNGRNLPPVEDLNATGQQAWHTYHVVPGDTLYAVAWAYGLDPHALARMNRLKPPFALVPGQLLRWQRHLTQTYWTPPPSTHVQPHRLMMRSDPVKHTVQTRNNAAGWSCPVSACSRQERVQLTGYPGVAFLVQPGTLVKASAPGQVVYAGHGLRGYGRLVLIKHAGGNVTAYAFEQHLSVTLGQRVRRGEVVGRSGVSFLGIPMVYFEIRHGSRPISLKRYALH